MNKGLPYPKTQTLKQAKGKEGPYSLRNKETNSKKLLKKSKNRQNNFKPNTTNKSRKLNYHK
jgi:hypothetical protein